MTPTEPSTVDAHRNRNEATRACSPPVVETEHSLFDGGETIFVLLTSNHRVGKEDGSRSLSRSRTRVCVDIRDGVAHLSDDP